MAANFLGASFEPPFLCLVASGGHTFLARVEDHAGYTVLGRTLDDAAGEAFDKGARMLGLPYPGGPALERLAAEGDPGAYDFPIAAGVAGLDFSFAGLKTALLYKVRDLGDEAQARRADLAASYQHAIVEALALRVERGLRAHRAGAAGRRRRRGGQRAAARAAWPASGVELHVPERALCTDNAAMIASAARWVTPLREFGDLDAYASGERGHLSLVLYGRAGLPPVRRGARPCSSGSATRSRRSTSRPTTSCWPATSCASRSIALDGDELYDFFVNEADLRGRLAARVPRA